MKYKTKFPNFSDHVIEIHTKWLCKDAGIKHKAKKVNRELIQQLFKNPIN